jgi:hypothetical protein
MILKTKDAQTAADICMAIQTCENVIVDYIRPINAKHTRFRLKLTVRSSKEKYGKRGFSGRRAHALCWHGFRDAFRKAFEVDPDCEFHTALAKWKGKAHFEANFEESGYVNIGSVFQPLQWREACDCACCGLD